MLQHFKIVLQPGTVTMQVQLFTLEMVFT